MSTPTEVRVAAWRNGFSPIACNGKAPVAKVWQQRHETNAAEIELDGKLYPYAADTGVLTKRVPTIDIDITFQPAAEAVEYLARDVFEERGGVVPVRIGQAPKRAILLRTDEPFEKLSRLFTATNGSAHRIEILCDGQQVIIHGIHQRTGKPYSWHGGSPMTVPRDDLAYVRREDVVAFLDKASKLLADEFSFKPSGGVGSADAKVPMPPAEWRNLVVRTVAEGGRENALTRLAGHLLRKYVDPFVALELLQSWNACHCLPPLATKDVERIVGSIAGRELKRRGAA